MIDNSNLSETINCDVCGKKNITEEACPRCKNDLSVLRRIGKYSHYFRTLALKALMNMECDKALDYATRSWGLKRSEQAARCAFLSCCVSGDFKSATGWFRRCEKIGAQDF